MVVVPIGKAEPRPKPAVGALDTEGVIFAVQKSETVGTVQVANAVVPVVVRLIFVGQLTKVGGVTSGEQGFPPVEYSITNSGAPAPAAVSKLRAFKTLFTVAFPSKIKDKALPDVQPVAIAAVI